MPLAIGAARAGVLLAVFLSCERGPGAAHIGAPNLAFWTLSGQNHPWNSPKGIETLIHRGLSWCNPPAACRGLRGRLERKFGRPFACPGHFVRTCVYIDGFNLYYRALRGTPHRWLDVAAMARAALPAGHIVEKIKYYTARVSGRTDPDAPRRQHAYLRALETIPEVEIFYGTFMANKKSAGLVQPPTFRPVSTTSAAPSGLCLENGREGLRRQSRCPPGPRCLSENLRGRRDPDQ